MSSVQTTHGGRDRRSGPARQRWRSSLIAALLAACGAVHAEAQPATALADLSLEDLMNTKVETVVGASKYRQLVTEAPASVTIVTADEINRQHYRSIADILRTVRGFYVTYDRNYSYVGTRGFIRPGDYNSRILVLIDGHRLNDNIFGGALIGQEFPVDVSLIERVEVIRGPGSALYGSSAMLGVVNVITRRASELPGVAMSLVGGQQRTGGATLSYGRLSDRGTSLFVSGSLYGSQGASDLFFPEYADTATHGHVFDADGTRRANGLMNWSRGALAVQALYGVRQKQVPTGAFGALFNSPDTSTTDGQGYVDVSYTRSWLGGLQVFGRVFADHYAFSGYTAYEGDDEPVINHDLARGAWWGSELRLSRTFGTRHRLTGGLEFRDDVQQHQRNFDARPYVSYLDDRRDTNWRSLFAEDEWALGRRVRLHVGVRGDMYAGQALSLRPRVGLIVHPAPQTTVKLLYGEAFRAPTIYELHWVQADVSKSNPALAREQLRNTEVVLERYIAPRWRLSGNAFLLRVRDLVDQVEDADGLLVYRNRSAVNGSGFETEVEGRWENGLIFRASQTLQRSRNPLTHERLTNSPAALFQTSVTAPLPVDGLFVSGNLQAMSARSTLGGSTAPAYAVVNLSVNAPRLLRQTEVGFSIWNLFGRQYGDPGAEEHRQSLIAQDGRVVGVKARVRF